MAFCPKKEWISLLLLACIHLVFSSLPDVAEIPVFPVRLDVYTNQSVERGRLHQVFPAEFLEDQLFHFFDDPRLPEQERVRERERRRFPLAELRKILQCAPTEPDLDDHSGTLSLLKMAPPTRRSAELIAAWRESGWDSDMQGACRENIQMCGAKADLSKRGYYTKEVNVRGGFTGFGMLRVMNNTLMHDWPWGRERLPEWVGANDSKLNNGPVRFQFNTYSLGDHLMSAALSLVSDMPDSFLLIGSERPFLPWRQPYPAFSMAARLEMGDMPWPWEEQYMSSSEASKRAKMLGQGFSDETFSKIGQQLPWETRVPKAAFFAGYHYLRHTVYDQAVLRPDLIDAPLIISEGSNKVKPWNPLSTENTFHKTNHSSGVDPTLNKPGFIHFLQNLSDGLGGAKGWTPGHYKYIVVIGYELSTTGRLAHALSSGALVLLPKTPFVYRFSARLIPWVHYVPLSYSSADLIEKLEWLKANDDKAQQIARNAAAFAKSYLRFEDELCYALAALKAVADVEKGSDILQPFVSVPAAVATPLPVRAPGSRRELRGAQKREEPQPRR